MLAVSTVSMLPLLQTILESANIVRHSVQYEQSNQQMTGMMKAPESIAALAEQGTCQGGFREMDQQITRVIKAAELAEERLYPAMSDNGDKVQRSDGEASTNPGVSPLARTLYGQADTLRVAVNRLFNALERVDL